MLGNFFGYLENCQHANKSINFFKNQNKFSAFLPLLSLYFNFYFDPGLPDLKKVVVIPFVKDFKTDISSIQSGYVLLAVVKI